MKPMSLKMIVETCSYEMVDDEGRCEPEVTEIIESKEFDIKVVFDYKKKHYVPAELKKMLRPYVYLIELCVLDNMDYVEIAHACKVAGKLTQIIEDYEPSHEEYLVDILARLIYESGYDKIVPEQGSVMYRLLYVMEGTDEI